MGTKNNPGSYDCYANAEPDEPMFVLLARDDSAPRHVREWAYERAQAMSRGLKPESDQEMVWEALACADAMDAWRKENR
jgi:hypothetical protein